MKIGIITQPLLNNYGGVLQNYALQRVLIKAGHSPITLDQPLYKPYITFSYVKKEVRNIVHNLIYRKNAKLSFYTYKKAKSVESDYFKYFSDKYIVRTEKMYGKKKFREAAIKLNLEAIVVGSDQVWRPLYNSRLFTCFLVFTLGLQIKRISYAASLGIDKWELSNNETTKAKHLLSLFDFLSVREKSAVSLLKSHLGITPSLVLDPTFLLERSDYEKIVYQENEKESEGDLFFYILDPSAYKSQIVRDFEVKYGFRAFTVMPSHTISTYKPLYSDAIEYPAVTKWLRAFMDAKYIICDSFHGAVFSIIFNKPFFVLLNGMRGNTRFDTLLENFGLEDRIITSLEDIQKCKVIDWNLINKRVEEKRMDSLRLLLKSLE